MTGQTKLTVLAALLIALVLPSARAFAAPILPGQTLPDISALPLIDRFQYDALGLAPSDEPVRIADIPGNILILELFNRFCFTCMHQSVEIQKFAESLKSESLTSKIKILGIGIGNTKDDLIDFSKTMKVSFPMAPDPSFDFYYGLGDIDGAPMTFFLKKKDGRWLVADMHEGNHGAVEMMARVRVMLEGKDGKAPPFLAARTDRRSRLSDEEKLQFAKSLFVKMGVAAAPLKTDLASIDLYKAMGADGKPLDLFAVVAQRPPVCDLCHDSVFVLGIDKEGRIKGFLPVYVTKFGNEIWSEDDEKFLSSRLVGRKSGDILFKSDVDAVTSATMSSSIIFDEARRAAQAVKEYAGKTRRPD